VQIFNWISSARPLSRDLGCGSSELLSSSTAGLLLLSTLPTDQARGMLWRLNSDAAPDAKFDHAAMVDRVAKLRRDGHATGKSGFVASAHMSAILLPREIDERPLALGVFYPHEAARDADALIETMKHGIRQVFCDKGSDYAQVSSAPMEFIRAV
jgi:DNA-binding IclR family transcriptional regulator